MWDDVLKRTTSVCPWEDYEPYLTAHCHRIR